MQNNPPYKPGDSYAICAVCGFRFYHSQLKKDWRGLLVCKEDFEQRHPQELISVKKERISVSDPRPEGQPVFLEPGDVTPDDL